MTCYEWFERQFGPRRKSDELAVKSDDQLLDMIKVGDMAREEFRWRKQWDLQMHAAHEAWWLREEFKT